MGAMKRAVPVAVKHSASTIMENTTAPPRRVGHPIRSHCLIDMCLVRLLLGPQLPAYTLFGECRTHVARWAASACGYSLFEHVCRLASRFRQRVVGQLSVRPFGLAPTFRDVCRGI